MTAGAAAAVFKRANWLPTAADAAIPADRLTPLFTSRLVVGRAAALAGRTALPAVGLAPALGSGLAPVLDTGREPALGAAGIVVRGTDLGLTPVWGVGIRFLAAPEGLTTGRGRGLIVLACWRTLVRLTVRVCTLCGFALLLGLRVTAGRRLMLVDRGAGRPPRMRLPEPILFGGMRFSFLVFP